MIADALSVIATGTPPAGTSPINKESSSDAIHFAGLVERPGKSGNLVTGDGLATTEDSAALRLVAGEDPALSLTGAPLQVELESTGKAALSEEAALLVTGPAVTDEALRTNAKPAAADALRVDDITKGGRAAQLAPKTSVTGLVTTASATSLEGEAQATPALRTAGAQTSAPLTAELASKTGLPETPPTLKASAQSNTTEPSRKAASDLAALTATEDKTIKTESARALHAPLAAASTTAASLTTAAARSFSGETPASQLSGVISNESGTPLFGDVRGLTSEGAIFLQRVHAAATPTTAARPEAFQQVADTIRLQTGDNRVMLRLDPPELGRVGIELSFDNHRLVTAVLTAENGDTASLLRRSLDSLQRELSSAGFEGVNIDFADHTNPETTANLDLWGEERELTMLSPVESLGAARGRMNIVSADRIDARF